METLHETREREREQRRQKMKRQAAKRRGTARRRAREQAEIRELDRALREFPKAFGLAIPWLILMATALAA